MTVKGALNIVAVLVIVIGASGSKCTNEERQGVVDKNLYHKYKRFLPEDCSIYDENKKVFAEIKTLCGVSTEVYSPDFFKELRENDCHDKLLELSDEVTFLEFLTENNRRKLGDLKLDSKSRRRLRKLHNALLTEPYDETVCLPFLTDEDAKLASELDKKLGEIEDGSLTLKSCLERGCTQKEVEQKLQQQTLDSFIKKWQAVFGSKNQDSAKRELEKLDYGKLKQLESQDRLKMRSLVAFISDDDKKLIYRQLGFDKDYPFDQIKLKKVVAIRNTLRKVDAALKGNKTEPEPVYLPLFTNEDVNIVKFLLLELGKNTLKPYLDMLPKEIVRNVKLARLIKKWNVGTEKEQKKLEKRFKCRGSQKTRCEKVLKQLDEYLADSLKMSALVAFIDDKERIYKQLGFKKNDYFDNSQLKNIVAIRNALRKLYAALKGNKTESEPVYIPLFSDEDARIISTLQDRLKKVKIVESDNLLAGLRRISEIAQDVEQLDNYGARQKLKVTQKWNLNENLTDPQIKAHLSQQLDKFSDSKNLRHKIDKLIKSIEAVRGKLVFSRSHAERSSLYTSVFPT
ncbi:MAG: hypothetical protein ABFS56_21560 [Pseudomonadota bacterium]